MVKQAPSGGTLFVWVYSTFSVTLLLPVVLFGAARGSTIDAVVVKAGVVSALLHTAYAITLQRAYTRADMNVVYPVARGMGPVLVVVFAAVALRQHLTIVEMAGVAVILGGAIVVASRRSGDRDLVTVEARRSLAGPVRGLLVGATIAGYTLWDDHAMKDLGVDALPYYTCTAVVQCVVLTVLCWRRRREAVVVVRHSWRPALLVAVLVPASYVAVLFALTMAPVALVAPLRSTSIVFGSIAGWLLLGEPAGRRRLLGAVVVVLGVGLLVVPSG
ncbi:EamA family transporter [Sanguibacter antarcticus]|uniref:EamA family transporter n=1 Tax=Sanguibacter antarcticus TaxID=372484 RepID=UPI00117B0149|nr:EamA family transporter [Sanguibacter antarcticus]